MGERIILTDYEMEMARSVGSRRALNAILGRRDNYAGKKEDTTEPHIIGAAAEIAVARYLGVYWSGHQGVFRSVADLPGIEVRWTATAGLIIRPRDKEKETKVYILAQGWPPEIEIIGWYDIREELRQEWITDFGRPNSPECWLIPKKYLHEIREMKHERA